MPTRDTPWPQGTPCWVDVQVDDTAAARAYYSTLFDWDIQDAPAEAGGYLMALLDGRPAAGIGPKPQGQVMPSVWSTYLSVDDADATTARAVAAGATPFMPPFDVLDLGRMTFLADPTGAGFGIWEAKSHHGVGIFNQQGALCWNELHTRNLPAAQDFYTQVFGYYYTPMMPGYATFELAGTGADAAIGGFCDDGAMGVPPGSPAHWLTWFQVDDVDATLATAAELGSAVAMGPEDAPVGRMAVVIGAQGEAFGIITPRPVDASGDLEG